MISDNMDKGILCRTEEGGRSFNYRLIEYHFIQSCWGMLIGLIPCLIGAGLYAWLFL
jgi:hypothetical protein